MNDKLYDMFIEDDLDYEELESRLDKLFNLYHEFGYDVRLSDFTKIFNNQSADYKKDNKLIRDYMSFYFNRNYNYMELLLKYGDNLDMNSNPLYQVVKRAMIIFNNNHIDIYKKISDKLINEKMVEEKRIQDELKLKKREEKKIRLIEELNDKRNKLLSYSPLINEKIIKKMNYRELIILNNDIPKIMELMLRYLIYATNKYSINDIRVKNGYNTIQENIEELNRLQKLVINEINENNKDIKVKEDDKGIFSNLFNKKKNEIERLNKIKNTLLRKKRILSSEYTNLVNKKNGFMHEVYQLDKIKIIIEFFSKLGVKDLNNEELLFGVCSFDNIDNYHVIIRSNPLIEKYQIICDDDNIDNNKMWNVVLDYYKSDLIQRRKK